MIHSHHVAMLSGSRDWRFGMPQEAKKNRQMGFSLLELMAAMTVMGIVLGAVFSLMGSGLKASTMTYELTDAQENLRIAQEYITRDLTAAGDGLKSVGRIKLPMAFVNPYITYTPVPAPSPSSDTDHYPPMGVLISDNNIAGTHDVLNASPAVKFKDVTDRITILAESPGFLPVSLLPGKITQTTSATRLTIDLASVSKFTIGDVISVLGGSAGDTLAFGLITDIESPASATPVLVLANSNTYGLNEAATVGGVESAMHLVGGINSSNTSTLGASIIRMQIIQYYVNNSGYLMRRVFGLQGQSGQTAPFVDSVVADHVVNIQFRYFTSQLDVNGNVVAPVLGITDTDQQWKVAEVESIVTVETVHQTLANGTRQQLSSTSMAAVRNLQFTRARTDWAPPQ